MKVHFMFFQLMSYPELLFIPTLLEDKVEQSVSPWALFHGLVGITF